MQRVHMFRNCLSQSGHRLENDHESFASEHFNQMKTRLVWVTNYSNDETFLINVPIHDCLSSMKTNLSVNEYAEHSSMFNRKDIADLSKLNLNQLLFLLHQLQNRSLENQIESPISSSNHSLLSFKSPIPIRTDINVHESDHSMRKTTATQLMNSSMSCVNLADIPKQLTKTLVQPISSVRSSNLKPIHSPNDVVTRLVQTFRLDKEKDIPLSTNNNLVKHRKKLLSKSNYSYQQSQEHKEKLICNLFQSNMK